MKLADPTNLAFRELHNVVECRYREFHEKGIGVTRKQAEIVSKEEEQGLWESGTLGAHSPLALLNSVFFYNGLYFVLRGGDEHRNLKISQLTFRKVDNSSNPDEKIEVMEYREFSSKN